MTVSPFAKLGLIEPILHALADRDYDTPTPIQARAIPLLLQGRDLLGIAQTGTGKTAAFALPILQRLHQNPRRPEPRRPRALVLAPTRELASQIVEAFRTYGKKLQLRHEVVYGGVGMVPQVRALHRGLDVLVATPGRLLDHMKQRNVDLSGVEYLVLDEADRMLDMGFVRDVERILSTLPKKRQSLLFSATMPTTVASLARGLLHTPERIEVTPPAQTTELVAQSICYVAQANKRDMLVRLLRDPEFARTLVFTRTKHGADRVAKHLIKSGIDAKAIHGDKSQGQRERALADFRSGKSLVLIATDLAARGIDVPEVSHVVNFDLPNIPESYVHRIGRTARAGREGIAISFCSPDEKEFLRDIEKLIRQRIPSLKTDGLPHVEEHRPDPQPDPRQRSPQHRGAQHRSAQRGAHPPRAVAATGHGHGKPARDDRGEDRPDWAEIARSLGEPDPDLRDEEPRDPPAKPARPHHAHRQPIKPGRPAPRAQQPPQQHRQGGPKQGQQHGQQQGRDGNHRGDQHDHGQGRHKGPAGSNRRRSRR